MQLIVRAILVEALTAGCTQPSTLVSLDCGFWVKKARICHIPTSRQTNSHSTYHAQIRRLHSVEHPPTRHHESSITKGIAVQRMLFAEHPLRKPWTANLSLCLGSIIRIIQVSSSLVSELSISKIHLG